MKKIFLSIAIAISTIKAHGQQHVVTYYDAFNIHKKEMYDLDKNAKMHGKYTSYFEDGTIMETSTYVHDSINGKYTMYVNEDNVRGIAKIYNYKMGRPDGLQQDFLTGGANLPLHKKPYGEAFYKDGQRVWMKDYDFPNQNESKRYLWQWTKFKDDKECWVRGYHPDGTVWYSGNLVRSTDQGTYVEDSIQGGKPFRAPSYRP